MLVFRPSCAADLPGLLALAASADGGLTTLPPKEEALQERIEESERSIAKPVKRPGSENYLFVLEDQASRTIIGTSGLAARVGGYEPFYTYEIRHERFSHPPLKIEKDVAVLHLKEVHRGPSEICSLLLDARHRRAGTGRLLSLARFLFMRAFPERFADSVIAELRGYIDQEGKSPFWEAVGRPFFESEFYAVDYLCGAGDKGFIADLMPEHPIYTNLLPPAVQAVIGRVHPDTTPALALLEAEGFKRTGEVDIFDAGPVLRAPVADLRTIRQARSARVRRANVARLPEAAPRLLSNSELDFRAVLGGVIEHEDGTVSVDRPTAAALNVEPGDTLNYVEVR